MANTNFVDSQTPVVASWLNDVNNFVYEGTIPPGSTFPSSNVTYTPSGSGAVATTVQNKLRETVSVKDFGAVGDGVTDDTAAIQAAIDQCVANSNSLNWPAGSYKTTANLTNFHGVTHTGLGVVVRGTNSFYITATTAHGNTLYVSPTGTSTNDGLSASQPRELQSALTALNQYGPVLLGKWNVILAAGTYTSPTRKYIYPPGLQSEYPVVITGPNVGGHPNVPTAIIDGDESSTGVGLQTWSNCSLYVKNIKFIDFLGGGGIFVEDGCFLATDNVHTSNCYDGILCYHGRLYVGGGIYELYPATGSNPDNYSAIKSMFQTHHTIGAVYDIDTGNGTYPADYLGPQISCPSTRVGRAVHIAENSTGHVHSLNINKLTTGINATANSRANVQGCDFKKCGIALEAEYSSNFNVAATTNNKFNAGTSDANDTAYRFHQASVETSAYNASMVPQIVEQEFAPTPGTVTGTTTETTLYTLADFIRGYEFGRFGLIRAKVTGTFLGSSGNKTIRMKIGGRLLANVTFPAATSGDTFIAELTSTCSGENTQYTYSWGLTNGSTSSVAGIGETHTGTTTVTIANGTAQDLTVTGLLANASDTINIQYVEIIRGGS